MPDKEDNSYRQLWILGAAMTLPLILCSGPIAGYLVGRFIFVKLLGFSTVWIPIVVVLGFIASGMQAYRLIQKIKQSDSPNS